MYKIIITCFIFVLILFQTSLFIVHEGQIGIVLRFDKILRDSNNYPKLFTSGLHLKVPFIDTIKLFDNRIQLMNNTGDHFITKEKKDLIIDSYIKWRINNFGKYYLFTEGGDITKAEILLKRQFNDRLHSEISNLQIKDIINDSHNNLTNNIRNFLNHGNSKQVIFNSKNKNEESVCNFNNMLEFGIEVIDIGIKRISLPAEISDAVFKRMRIEHQTIADNERMQGQQEAEKLRAQADYKATSIVSEAKRNALIIKGDSDKITAKLISDAFGKSTEFYIFLRSLEAYEKIFYHNNDLLLLNVNNNLFRYMNMPLFEK
ncbi:MAG: protease modulator HflC [Pantoea sp. Brub]|nr:protease modulator HflC [Pantoea sp. Brub]